MFIENKKDNKKSLHDEDLNERDDRSNYDENYNDDLNYS